MFRRTKRTAPGSDAITYANWRWVDPQGLILATIYNICRINTRVPHSWKHSKVTLIHKGVDTATICNWRPTISPDESSVLLVKVCCPFEGSPTALEDAEQPMRQTLLQKYSSVEILPFIIGALGSWYPPNDRVLSRLHIGRRYASLMWRLCVVSAISGSQTIWYNSRSVPLSAVLDGGITLANAGGGDPVGPNGGNGPANAQRT